MPASTKVGSAPTAARPSSLMSPTTTRASSSAKSVAIARPMPDGWRPPAAAGCAAPSSPPLPPAGWRSGRGGAETSGQLHEGGGLGDAALQADPAGAPPGERVRDLLDQGLVDQAVAVLQVHESEIGVDGHRGSSDPAVEAAHEGREEAGIVEYSIDPGQLLGKEADDLGEQLLPQGGLAIVQAQHGRLRERCWDPLIVAVIIS